MKKIWQVFSYIVWICGGITGFVLLFSNFITGIIVLASAAFSGFLYYTVYFILDFLEKISQDIGTATENHVRITDNQKELKEDVQKAKAAIMDVICR